MREVSRILGRGCIVVGLSATLAAAPPAISETKATPIRNGFHFDVPGVVGRSDVILGRPNRAPTEAMPLGNGRLGVAAWSGEGFTAQLNRNDTLPDRLSAGQLVIPGVAALTGAADYAGRLDLYKGELREHGGQMSLTAYVEPRTDALIVDVTGAKPDQRLTAFLRLWSPRAPRSAAEGSYAYFVESWLDNRNPGASGRAFGSLCAITAVGRGVTAAVTDPLTLAVSFTPLADGHFRVVVASPHYDGNGNASAIARRELTPAGDDAHRAWWRDFWARADLIKVHSSDGAAEYMENLRNLYLFVAAVERGFEYPGSQAGVADMISSARDIHRWDPSAFWHFNLRMQVAANIGAGLPELNETYFNLYRENLARIEQWTHDHMKELPGSCVPETMRFNGAGFEYEGSWKPVSIAKDCAMDSDPYYNARTLSTGAEVSLWIWRQYLATGDRGFLEANYPVMASAARFLLAYQKGGPDGLLHTSPSNAHENQWDVSDPTTDISAIRALYPATIEAATVLNKDAALVKQLQDALARTPTFPQTLYSEPKELAPPSAGEDSTVIAESYLPGAEEHNIENVGLEPVWPYELVGQSSTLFALALRTYEHRPNKAVIDWSFDPIQAARLGLGGEVGTTLVELTKKFQGFVNGMSKWSPEGEEFYVEQSGVVAAALEEALVQDEDGVLRIAPAIPPGWDFDGTVSVRGRTKIDVETRGGAVTALHVEAGARQQLRLRNPWPGEPVDVVAVPTNKTVLSNLADAVIGFETEAGVEYTIQNHRKPAATAHSIEVSGVAATRAKRLGPVQIGLFASRP